MTYTTKQGDTWDWIARKIYGAEKYFPYLIQQNPEAAEVFVFDAGVKLTYAALPQEETETAPPWRT